MADLDGIDFDEILGGIEDIEDLEDIKLKKKKEKEWDFYEVTEEHLEKSEEEDGDQYYTDTPITEVKPSSKYQTSKTKYNPRVKKDSKNKKKKNEKKDGGDEDIDFSSVQDAIIDGNDIRRQLSDLL